MAESSPDLTLKLLMIGESGVGKSSVLLRYCENVFDDLAPTIGVDFKVKFVRLRGKLIKLTIWDTAGQERFRTLTSSYYRGAHGIILVHDVTRRETFDLDKWISEIDIHTGKKDAVKMLIGNKVDLAAAGGPSARAVPREEALDFSRKNAMMYIDCSAKTKVGIHQAFDEVVLKILDTPGLVDENVSQVGGINLVHNQKNEQDDGGCGC